MEIKPIETHYKGYRFRSRLEARWAVFFETLGCKWIYEKEGYQLADGINYLPDFWITQMREFPGFGRFVEIKQFEPSVYERKKLELLATKTGTTVFCFWDLNSTGFHGAVYSRNGACHILDCLCTPSEPNLKQIKEDGTYNFSPLPFGYFFQTIPDEWKKYLLNKAIAKALSAHFEFGEEG